MIRYVLPGCPFHGRPAPATVMRNEHIGPVHGTVACKYGLGALLALTGSLIIKHEHHPYTRVAEALHASHTLHGILLAGIYRLGTLLSCRLLRCSSIQNLLERLDTLKTAGLVGTAPQTCLTCPHIYDIGIVGVHRHTFTVAATVLVTAHLEWDIGPSEGTAAIMRIEYGTIT